jgi:hypothetical protein
LTKDCAANALPKFPVYRHPRPSSTTCNVRSLACTSQSWIRRDAPRHAPKGLLIRVPWVPVPPPSPPHLAPAPISLEPAPFSSSFSMSCRSVLAAIDSRILIRCSSADVHLPTVTRLAPFSLIRRHPLSETPWRRCGEWQRSWVSRAALAASRVATLTATGVCERLHDGVPWHSCTCPGFLPDSRMPIRGGKNQADNLCLLPDGSSAVSRRVGDSTAWPKIRSVLCPKIAEEYAAGMLEPKLTGRSGSCRHHLGPRIGPDLPVLSVMNRPATPGAVGPRGARS